MWTIQRQESLNDLIKINTNTSKKYFCFLKPDVISSSEHLESIYHPTDFDDTNNIVASDWTQLKLHESYTVPCFYIITAHGSDISDSIWNLRSKAHPLSVFSLWHFDNHVGYMANYISAITVDLNFISHNLGITGYLTNPIAAIAAHIPSCSMQFGADEIRQEQSKYKHLDRISKGLFNYVSYENAPRAITLNTLSQEINDIADFKLMPSNDRSRYWGLTRTERYLDWAAYKCSVIVPLVQDLSTRVFDALATGQIPVIPEEIRDLDLVMTRDIQHSLGIVRIDNLSSECVRHGIIQAIQNFDDTGYLGIVKRTEFVINHALIGHRISSMLEVIDEIGSGKRDLVFGNGINGIGAYLNS